MLRAEKQKPADSHIFTRVFWLAYLANVTLVCANALTFRFAELVNFLGGSEQISGSIVSIGVMAALTGRLVLGQLIDRYGPRIIWIGSTLLFVMGCGAFFATSHLSITIYLARVAYAMGLGGMVTCSMVHIQNQVPFHKRTEIIALFGSSGFVGMITGSLLGDFIFHHSGTGKTPFLFLFGGSFVLGLAYIGLILSFTRNENHSKPRITPPIHRLIFRYWPGNVAWVAMQMGMAFTVMTVYLTRYATEIKLSGIGTFFTIFSVSAFIFRLWSRSWNNSMGRHRLIQIGLIGQCTGLFLLAFVKKDWQYTFPAIGFGLGHALLFPSVISLGSGSFPRYFRGTGTTIVIGFTEVGAMISAPILGWTIDSYGFTPMFMGAGCFGLFVSLLYTLTDARQPDDDLIKDVTTIPEKVINRSPQQRLSEEPVSCETCTSPEKNPC
jgi:MFS family permease